MKKRGDLMCCMRCVCGGMRVDVLRSGCLMLGALPNVTRMACERLCFGRRDALIV